MTAPYQRRRDPIGYAQSWEVAVCVIGFAAIGLALAALAGLGIAAVLFGDGWIWPHGIETIGHTLGGLAGGHPGRGLPPADVARAAGRGPTYLCVAVCEATVIAGSAAAGVALARRLRNNGIATRRDAEQVLGISALRQAREIIRPDLYGRPATRTSSRSPLAQRRGER